MIGLELFEKGKSRIMIFFFLEIGLKKTLDESLSSGF